MRTQLMRRAAATLCCALALSVGAVSCYPAECYDGRVPVGSEVVGSGDGDSELPDEFDFTAAEFVAAIEGLWHDPSSGVDLQVSIPADAFVSYLVVPGRACMGSDKVVLTIAVDVLAAEPPFRLDASFVTYSQDLELGLMHVKISPLERSELWWVRLVPSEPPRLVGSCPAIAGGASLSLQKVEQV